MLAVIFAAPCYAQLERVDALDFFSTYAGPIVYIEVADSQVLVFDASKNDVAGVGYVLHGRPLEIHAKNVEVTGEVVVRSFTDKEHGADAPPAIAQKARSGEAAGGQGSGDNGSPGQNGDNGSTGNTGGNGTDSAPFRIYIGSITGKGTLAFNSFGMGGGRGQDGQPGQDGQRGGHGHNRADGGSCGEGGYGGDGGIGGQGGQGGPGGSGGDIFIDESACSDPSILLLSPPSKPGQSGTPGHGGDRGGIGDGGGGKGFENGCENSQDRKDHHAGTSHTSELGPQALPGVPGATGKVICEGCTKQVTVDAAGHLKCM